MKRCLLMLLAAAGMVCPAQEKPAPPQAAREIIERYITAIGGRASIEKYSSNLTKGRTETTGKEIAGDLVVYAAKPNKLLVQVDIPGIGKILSGYDGRTGWSVNPLTGPMVLEGKALTDMARQADFFSILHEPKNFRSITLLDKTMFEGEECHKIKLVHLDGNETVEYYSVATGLQRGYTGSQESPFGPITATSVIHEHRRFGDVLLPTKVTQKMSGLEQTMTVDNVEFDKVPDAVFAPPPEIKALLVGETAPKTPSPESAKP